MADAGVSKADRPAGDGAGAPSTGAVGYRLYGVVRSGTWRGLRVTPVPDLVKIRYRDLEALTRTTTFEVPVLDATHVQEHQRVIEGATRRNTVLPLPFGIVFRGRRAVIRFLQDQYVVLDEGLAFLEGHWELRLHLTAAHDEAASELTEPATHIYTELRRHARAALPLPHVEGRVFGAAFLVERDSWIPFVERADDLVGLHPELSFDITGPWPPYDFVRVVS